MLTLAWPTSVSVVTYSDSFLPPIPRNNFPQQDTEKLPWDPSPILSPIKAAEMPKLKSSQATSWWLRSLKWGLQKCSFRRLILSW